MPLQVAVHGRRFLSRRLFLLSGGDSHVFSWQIRMGPVGPVGPIGEMGKPGYAAATAIEQRAHAAKMPNCQNAPFDGLYESYFLIVPKRPTA